MELSGGVWDLMVLLVFVKSIKAFKEFLGEISFCVTCRVLILFQARKNEAHSGLILDHPFAKWLE